MARLKVNQISPMKRKLYDLVFELTPCGKIVHIILDMRIDNYRDWARRDERQLAAGRRDFICI